MPARRSARLPLIPPLAEPTQEARAQADRPAQGLLPSSDKFYFTSSATAAILPLYTTPMATELKNLTDWFDKVYIINCANRPDRLEAVTKHLTESGMADMSKVTIVKGVIGDYVTHPANYQSGKGAWGCVRSMQNVAEDYLHQRDERGGLKHDNFLVLEDDVVFLDNALADLNEFMPKVPANWGQIYLGGQHRQSPEKVNDQVVIGCSVHRTHAYAVSRATAQAFYRHISYWPEYFFTVKHVDHQLEIAHQRRDWPVYCPKKWICGQEAGTSNISGKNLPRQTWI